MHMFKSSNTCTLILVVYTGKEKFLQYINEYIVPQWASRWRQLGKELGVDHYLMETIENDCLNSCQGCCFMMIEEWFDRNPSASIEGLIAATDNLSSHGMVYNYSVQC